MVEYRMRIHAICGGLCCLFFAEYSIIAKAEFSFKFNLDGSNEIVHFIFVYIFVPCIVLVGIGGCWARYWMQKLEW
jgi:hypothetical protein